MCGIVGWVSLNPFIAAPKTKEWFTKALFVDTLRGFDSTGVFFVPEKEVTLNPVYYKRAIPGPDFLSLSVTNRILTKSDSAFCMVGHNRKATMGSIRTETAHPFQHGSVTLVHNGTLTGWKGLDTSFAIDSEAICHALSQKPAKEVLEGLSGAYALVWYDTANKTINLARNSERPMHYAVSKDKKTMYFASLPWMVSELQSFSSEIGKVYELGVGKHVKISSDMSDILDMEVTKFTPYEPPKTTYPVYGGYNLHNFYGGQHTLRDYGYAKGEKVYFTLTSFDPYGGVSTKGTLKGITESQPYDPVVCYQVETKIVGKPNKYKDKLFVGEADYVTHQNGKVCLILTNVKVHTGKRENKNTASTSDKTKQSQIFKGPNHTYITREAFLKLVEGGCAHCGQPVFPEDSDKISWIANPSDRSSAKEPICLKCTTTFGLTNH